MKEAMQIGYLQSAIREFEAYKDLGEKAITQLSDSQIHWQPNPESNSIAIIIKHLSGNMVSRWTDFLQSDGEKANRNRDAEFVDTNEDFSELMQQWGSGWDCLFNAIKPLKDDEDMRKIIYIRKKPQTVYQALNRQLTHYAYHIGQIVYIAKQVKGPEWVNLSIPVGKSADFNKAQGM